MNGQGQGQKGTALLTPAIGRRVLAIDRSITVRGIRDYGVGESGSVVRKVVEEVLGVE